MGQIQSPSPVLLIIAASSRYAVALEWGLKKAQEEFGAVALTSYPFDFTDTDYYTATMGSDLRKQFFAFAEPVDPQMLARVKQQTNQWEIEYARQADHPEPRPLNLDPGYFTRAKLVLASTKDHAHRIYLQDGIYAEVTLSFRRGEWRSFDWTYPDYQREDYQQFFTRCRELLR